MYFGSKALLAGVLLIVPVASAQAQQESRRGGRQTESPTTRPEDTPRRAEPREVERPQPERRSEEQAGRREEPAVTRPRAEPEPARSTGDPELKRRKR